MPDCLDALVGLSANDSTCFETGRPSEYNTSESGYYITDADYGFPMLEALEEAKNTDDANVWDVLQKALDGAILQFRTDFAAKIRDIHSTRVKTFNGVLGELKSNSTFNPSKSNIGVSLIPQHIKDGQFIITGIWVGLDSTETFDLVFLSTDPTYTQANVSVNSNAGQFVKTDLSSSPITLDFQSDLVSELEYFIGYALPSGAKPLYNKFWCGCGSTKPLWMNHIKAQGFQSDQLTDADDISGSSQTPFGLALEGYFACNELNWLCELDKVAGYPVKQVIARAIQTNAAAIAISEALKPNRISKFNTVFANSLQGKYNERKTAYMDYLDWLVINFPKEATGCLECKSAKSFRKVTIAV